MSPRAKKKPSGTVTFIGAGPGDPRLLTLRAVEVLAEADVVVADAATRTRVVCHCRPDVEVLDPVSADDGEPLAAAARAKLIVTAARSGRTVVRGIGGDPVVDQGVVDEIAAVAKAKIPFEVVPGVAVSTGVPAYAGIPLTGPRASGGVRVLDISEASIDWATVGSTDGILVLRGPVDQMAEIAQELVAGGRKPATPVAVTTQGTTTEQRTITSTLAAVAADLKAARVTLPAVTVIGDVVGQRDALSWFETKPLFGWRVLVPRTKEQSASLSEQLRSYGAVPHEVPTIAVEPPRTPQQMERAIKGLVTGRYEWVAFTSTNAVKAVRERFEEYGLDARAFAGIKVAAVGEQTAKALIDFGVKPDLVPSGEQSAAGLLEDWPPYDSVFDPIDRVFLPRADIATETLVAGLVELGWEVDDVTAYRTVRAAPPPAETREAIKGGGFDAVLFTSSSTVRNLVGIAGKPHAVTVIACIGSATAKTAEEHGLRVDVMAPEPSVGALAEALAEFGAARRTSLIEAGEPVTKPSERRPGSRRKAK
ncbi:bifunctional uroporphyrinogen-III C-methyltransferase/uroporphyrinogen-III synthase [Yinghuangia sp. ASG 101]|uniref:uroporphyrinogen-III synthase n=1 Tax=Yinghuangia sp. ASG 101 TaxID=2896848 RepID=UPI001E3DF3F6|nr:bifunctional uroporphyrinogen-III C-methyltransferase/uroporphyrinogen-III synthase [Yinghuangia sp. ASG 101]UGQ09226.1 bifunctional uroporphyrinogen-III C-methyltransferase/uroporphyrinogen-III synthase [Yinghuangia sp. ASG 101]